VLLPEPEGPTIAVDSPLFIVKVAFYNIVRTPSFYVLASAFFYFKLIPFGYLKETLENDICSSRMKLAIYFPSSSFISGFLSMTSKTFAPTTLAFIIAYMFGLNDVSSIIPITMPIKIVNKVPALYSRPVTGLTCLSSISLLPIQKA
jgi:hypothetical protein